MARDQEPVSEEELEAAEQRLDELREQVREDLAADLDGGPENYNADTYHIVEPGPRLARIAYASYQPTVSGGTE